MGHRNRPVSWVRRGIRMTEGQEAAWQQHGHKYLIEPPRSVARESIAAGWVLDLAQFPAKKLVVEIGTGRGENIVAAAAREPDTDFLGVEVYGPGLARAILLAESAGTGTPLLHVNPEIAQAVAGADRPAGLTNLHLIQADAPELLAALPENSVDEFWVFFPDPWPKNRHLKRRLIDEDFIPLIARVLKPGGIIRLATDWAHYADQMQEVFAAASGIFEPGPEADNAGRTERFAGRVLTAFESKGIREGRDITDLAFRRRNGRME